MTTIVTRAGKGSALTHNEVDANFTNLNNAKYESGDSATLGASSISANTSTDALRITQTGTGNAFVVEDSASPDATPFVIDAAGNVIAGHTVSVPSLTTFASAIQVHGNAAATASSSITRYSTTDSAPASFRLARSRTGTIGGQGLLLSNDTIGVFDFTGSDGGVFQLSARISGQIDGTPGTNDMPGRLVFSTTPSGSASPVERMRIDSAGKLTGEVVMSGTSDALPDFDKLVAVSGNSSLVYKGRITTGADLNTYYEPGVYRITSGSDAAAISNTPATSSGCTLEILSPDPIRSRGSRALCIQRYTQRRPERVFIRESNSTISDVWSAWREMVINGMTAPLSVAGDVRSNSVLTQSTSPTNSNTSATATASSLLGGIRTSTPTANINLTLPTGTNMDAAFNALETNQTIEWSVINLAAATHVITVVANTAHTVVGNMAVAANSSARFMTRKTAANTFITYRGA